MTDFASKKEPLVPLPKTPKVGDFVRVKVSSAGRNPRLPPIIPFPSRVTSVDGATFTAEPWQEENFPDGTKTVTVAIASHFIAWQ